MRSCGIRPPSRRRWHSLRSRSRGFDLHPELRAGRAASRGAGGQRRNRGRHTVCVAAVTKTDTKTAKVIERCLAEAGRTADTRLTAFTDGCAGLRRLSPISGSRRRRFWTGSTSPWACSTFGRRARGLPTRDQAQGKAKAVVVEAIERLRWRLRHGKVKDARTTIGCIRSVMRAYRDQQAQWRKRGAARQFWAALLGFDGYLTGQSAWLINYAARHRAGLRVGTALTEGAANHLVNRRMNKSQHMRWSRRGADLLLQVRCAVYNGQLTPALARFTCDGSPASGRDSMAPISSCGRERKPSGPNGNLRAARCAPVPALLSPAVQARRRCAGSAHGRGRTAASRRRSSSLSSSSVARQIEKGLARRPLAAAGSQEGIDDGILNVAVPEPILHEAQIGAGFEQVGGDGVLEAVEVALRRGAGRRPSRSASSASRACAARSGRPGCSGTERARAATAARAGRPAAPWPRPAASDAPRNDCPSGDGP